MLRFRCFADRRPLLSNLKGEAVAIAVRMRLRDIPQQDQECKLPKIIAETSSSIGRDLGGPNVEAAETPFDINECVTVVQDLQQFRDDNSSLNAASTGIKDVPVTPTGWIPRVGDLVCEKVAVKKEFGPSYRAPSPSLGNPRYQNFNSTTVVRCQKNRFASIDNVKLHHVANPAMQTKGNNQ
ncbi:hypothetical protein NDU88_005723 [Pleurodeles waltl]|uniref:Uncharacterized protein n=1 Tax=Pleurodeles waltl TaxID=8319 RepID=A0AAV7TV31_PLEWA|nr:hypothetical protein NDU88_005723 [Pleurodeles waltl]